MEKKFCLFLNHSARFNQDHFEPCCWIQKTANLNNPEELANYKIWLSQINDWVPECSFCKNIESRGIKSPRLQVADNPIAILGVHPNSEPTDITSLELQIDTECNSACLICGEHNSSTWQKYNVGKITGKQIFNKSIDLNIKLRTESRFKKLKENIQLDKINLLVFLGGEPLGNDLHKEMILEIKKVKSLNSISVRYITNASKTPDDETVQLWREMKNVGIVFSLDGIGEHFNYLRWPLQWDQVEKNIKYFLDLKLPNMSPRISSAINPFNIFYYDRYLAWENEFFKNSKQGINNTSYFGQAFETTGVINTACIPKQLADQVVEKYTLTEPWLIKHMNPFSQEKYDKFVEYIKVHDEKRNLNWAEVFPEIAEYFPQFN
jgi:hypothetical protein